MSPLSMITQITNLSTQHSIVLSAVDFGSGGDGSIPSQDDNISDEHS